LENEHSKNEESPEQRLFVIDSFRELQRITAERELQQITAERDCLLLQPSAIPLFSSDLHTAQYIDLWVNKLLPRPVIASSGRGSTGAAHSSQLTTHNSQLTFLLIVDT
jgi:hypothetical protein